MHDTNGRLIAEVEPSGQLRSHFVYGTESHSPDYMIKGGVRYYFAKDQLGSIRAVINVDTGTVLQTLHYDEFGKILSDTNPGFQPFSFAGGHFDFETGLVRFGARDYDSEVGRWLSKDPILFNGKQSNLYVYINNDSVNNIDPKGMFGWIAAGGILGAAINAYDTAKCGGSARQIIASAAVGGLTGSIGAALATYGVASAAIGGFTAGVANSTAQQIINSPGQENLGRALAGGAVEGLAGAAGTALTRGLNKVFSETFSETAGFVLGATGAQLGSGSSQCGCGVK